MALEIAKDKIRLSQIVCQKQELITIDGDVIVNDIKPDVLKVISTNGVICIYKKEVLNGKIKFEGCINTYIIYLADDEEGSIRTINTNLDFAEIIDLENCTEGMTLEDTLSIKGFETRILNGRKIHVKAFVDADLKVYSNTEIEAIVDIENNDNDIQMLNSNRKVLSLIGENTGKTTLKDTISIKAEDELAEIMKVSFTISGIETKTSYNKVLIKGIANVGIMYLTEDNRINEIDAQIPLMGFIDMPNVTDSSKCLSRVKLKNLIIRQNNSEEHSMYIEADLELFCKVYEEKDINIIEDLYSISKDVDLKKVNVRTRAEEFRLRDILEIRQRLDSPELMYGRILGVNIVPILEEANIRDGVIKYTGKLNSEFMMANENNVTTVKIDIPFETELHSKEITNMTNVETELNIISQKTITGDDGVTLEIQLEINAVVQNNERIDFVQEVITQEPQNMDTYSMMIYFVKPQDTLWKIAKMFRSRVEDIARVNKIEDENKIYPGQQLYIPKFTNNKIVI